MKTSAHRSCSLKIFQSLKNSTTELHTQNDILCHDEFKKILYHICVYSTWLFHDNTFSAQQNIWLFKRFLKSRCWFLLHKIAQCNFVIHQRIIYVVQNVKMALLSSTYTGGSICVRMNALLLKILGLEKMLKVYVLHTSEAWPCFKLSFKTQKEETCLNWSNDRSEVHSHLDIKAMMALIKVFIILQSYDVFICYYISKGLL